MLWFVLGATLAGDKGVAESFVRNLRYDALLSLVFCGELIILLTETQNPTSYNSPTQVANTFTRKGVGSNT